MKGCGGRYIEGWKGKGLNGMFVNGEENKDEDFRGDKLCRKLINNIDGKKRPKSYLKSRPNELRTASTKLKDE